MLVTSRLSIYYDRKVAIESVEVAEVRYIQEERKVLLATTLPHLFIDAILRLAPFLLVHKCLRIDRQKKARLFGCIQLSIL